MIGGDTVYRGETVFSLKFFKPAGCLKSTDFLGVTLIIQNASTNKTNH